MTIYQAIDKSKPIVVPGVSNGFSVDRTAFIQPSYQTMSSDPQCLDDCSCGTENKTIKVVDSNPNFIEVYKDAQELKDYINQKDLELAKKIEVLNSKINKLVASDSSKFSDVNDIFSSLNLKIKELQDFDKNFSEQISFFDSSLNALRNKVEKMDVSAGNGIKVITIPDTDIKQITLQISPDEKIIAADAAGIYSSIKVNFDVYSNQVKLLGLNNQEISSCEINFIPDSIKKITKGNKTVIQFSWKNGQTMEYDINQFLDITYDNDGCLIINGRRLFLKVAEDDNLLYVDENHNLRTRSLLNSKEFQDISTRLSNNETEISIISTKINGGTVVDPSTGETKDIQSVKEEVIGKSTDEIKIDASGNIENPENITIMAIKNYVDNDIISELYWNEANNAIE